MSYPNLHGVKNLLVTLSLPEGQRWENEAPIIRSIIPSGSRVLTHDHWWCVGDFTRVHSTVVAHWISPEEVDYIILTAQGSGSLGKYRPIDGSFEKAIQSGQFEMIYNHLDTQRPTLMGIPLANSSSGAGAVVYKNTKTK